MINQYLWELPYQDLLDKMTYLFELVAWHTNNDFKLYLSRFYRSVYLFQVFHMVLCSREDKGLLRRFDQVLKNVQQHSWNKAKQWSWNNAYVPVTEVFGAF